MTHYTGTLYLDASEGSNECEAVYEIDAIWSQGDVYPMSVSLLSWTFNERQQNRETAVKLLGDGEVQRQEGEAVEAWLDTALRNMADERADSREWLAAE